MWKRVIKRPLKVLMVFHTSSLTGPTRATLSLLKGIDKEKYKIDVACPKNGEFVNDLRDMGIRHIALEFGRNKDILTLVNLVFILKKNKYHILHGHLGRVVPIICLAGKVTDMPAIILTEHTNDPKHSWIGKNRLRLFLHKASHIISNNFLDKVIAVSGETKRNYIIRQGIPEDKVVTLPNSIYFPEHNNTNELQKEALRKELGFNNDDIIIGMIGRLVKEKGYADVILAAKTILDYNSNVRFLFIGEGPERSRLETLTRENNLTDKIFFLGFRQDVDYLIKILDILVQPSMPAPPESFGLVLIEAMANHIPVICSDIALFREIVKDGQTGLLFQEKNPVTLADKVVFLLKNKNLSEELACRGYALVKEKFNSQIIAEKTGNLYKEVLFSKGYRIEPQLMHTQQDNCILCGYGDFLFLFKTKGVDLANEQKFMVVKCKSCGLIFLGNRLSKEELNSFGFKDYSLRKGNNFFTKSIYFLSNLFVLKRVKKIRQVKEKGAILDIGCGEGAFLRKIQERGWDCYGIDIFPYAVDLGLSKEKIKLFYDDIEQIKLPLRFFDVITFWHSFEHLAQPSNTLNKVHSLLKDNGIVFISVPNVESFEARISMKHWYGLELPWHHYMYSPKTLVKLLEINKFSVISMSKNSLEYNLPFFVQSFFNFLGGEHNLLHIFFKQNKTSIVNPFLRLYTLILIVVLFPFVFFLCLAIYVINILCYNGPVIEIFAKKK